jgi:hypothetical protein
MSPNKPFKPLNQSLEVLEYETLRNQLLFKFRQKQPFRIAIGKDTWTPFEEFKQEYNLREILKDEIVIEFDSENLEIVTRAISQTGINLNRAGYTFEYWDHGGKSPHLHIHNLPIAKYTESQRATFKKLFVLKYVPKEYHQYVDLSLCGIHLIALEWSKHWKGICGYKKLISIYNSQFKNESSMSVIVIPDKELKAYLDSKGLEFHSTAELNK